MKRSITAVAALFITLLGFGFAHAGETPPADGTTTPAETPAIKLEGTTDNIKDLTATLRVVKTDFNELGKIGKEFKRSYYFKRMLISYKNPNKTRLETKAAGITGIIVFDGDTRYYKLPFRKETKNIHGHPGQKQTLLQLGIFSMDYLTLDYQAHFIKKDGALLIYNLTQRDTNNHSHEIVWVNPKTHIIERRQSVNGDGKLTMETRYKNPLEVEPGIFLPTLIEVYNQYGKLGGTQKLEDLKVNKGVKDDVFATK